MTDNTVANPSSEHAKVMMRIRLPRTLMGSTYEMRRAKIEFLPREEAESDMNYENRLRRSVLFNAFGKTVKDMTGKVFSRPVIFGEDVPANIKEYAENIDLAGRHLNVFAKDIFYDGMQTGIAYILVDMPPPVQRADGKPATVADEQKVRPYFVHITCENLIGFQSEQINGVQTLTQVRIKEYVTEPDGNYVEKEISQIRVLRPGTWETWREDQTNAGKQWTLYDQGVTPLNFIPLVPVYIHRKDFMTGMPPLQDLADLNVEHWQSSSDQRNILHVARVPILFGAGFNAEDKIAVGASTMIRTSSSDSTLQYVEHSGAAIGAGAADLKDIEFRMQNMGLQLLVSDPGQQTATGEMRDESKENSPLAMMATALQDALETSLDFMAQFQGAAPDSGGSLTVNTDFGVGLAGAADLPVLLNATNANVISKQTFWAEMQRRDILSDDFDPDVEMDRLANEAPKLSMDLGDGSGNQPPPTKGDNTNVDPSIDLESDDHGNRPAATSNEI